MTAVLLKVDTRFERTVTLRDAWRVARGAWKGKRRAVKPPGAQFDYPSSRATRHAQRKITMSERYPAMYWG